MKKSNIIKGIFPKDFPNYRQTKDTTWTHGKTIKSITHGAINCWVVNFTDGSHINLWAENNGPLGLGQLWVSKE